MGGFYFLEIQYVRFFAKISTICEIGLPAKNTSLESGLLLHFDVCFRAILESTVCLVLLLNLCVFANIKGTYLFYGPQSPMFIKQVLFLVFAAILGLVALFASMPFLIVHLFILLNLGSFFYKDRSFWFSN